MNETEMSSDFDSYLDNSDLDIPFLSNKSLFMHYLILFAVIGLAVGLATIIAINFEDNFILFCLSLLILPIIHVSITSKYLGKEFGKGVATPVIITIPLSILSYLNELKNGCFCIFSCSSCPPEPSYYHYPMYSAFFGAVLLLIYSIVLQIIGKKARGFGVFTGLPISFVIFIGATVIGLFS